MIEDFIVTILAESDLPDARVCLDEINEGGFTVRQLGNQLPMSEFVATYQRRHDGLDEGELRRSLGVTLRSVRRLAPTTSLSLAKVADATRGWTLVFLSDRSRLVGVVKTGPIVVRPSDEASDAAIQRGERPPSGS